MIGARLGIDVGKARIGVSRCDPLQTLAVPLETVPRTSGATGIDDDIARIAELAAKYSVVDIVVGLPLSMSGQQTASTRDAEEFALALAQHLRSSNAKITVRLVDERLSTVSASRQLQQAGLRTKKTRGIIDQAAAVVILQHAIDMDRYATAAVGRLVGTDI
ncbi:Holliday junction resolvase RuvX [Canibacter sp. lx-72]|uniref:Holliday junction resolvase RuvX n=1 Tax=Canibacter zhuwentaonis TaxID=2837491 RepID=UPI001BDDBC33|nr:Holliday junction resolvase RuvX [Canibacter zhuwentaonis]MBT1035040.1 Holliday junction resolvase RuvX [Canibacter zhuwentaonis]